MMKEVNINGNVIDFGTLIKEGCVPENSLEMEEFFSEKVLMNDDATRAYRVVSDDWLLPKGSIFTPNAMGCRYCKSNKCSSAGDECLGRLQKSCRLGNIDHSKDECICRNIFIGKIEVCKLHELKYILLKDDTVKFKGKTLYRIQYLKSFTNSVKKFDLGGYIDSYNTLSQLGRCRVNYNSKVSNSVISGNAVVLDSNIQNGILTDEVKICGSISSLRIIIKDESAVINTKFIAAESESLYSDGTIVIEDNAFLKDCKVINSAKIRGSIELFNCVLGDGIVLGSNCSFALNPLEYFRNGYYAKLLNDDDYLFFYPVGSRKDYLLAYRIKKEHTGEEVILLSTGCFTGTIDDFVEAVIDRHNNFGDMMNRYGKVYLELVNAIRVHFRVNGVDNN